jgi:hypothetical protein
MKFFIAALLIASVSAFGDSYELFVQDSSSANVASYKYTGKNLEESIDLPKLETIKCSLLFLPAQKIKGKLSQEVALNCKNKTSLIFAVKKTCVDAQDPMDEVRVSEGSVLYALSLGCPFKLSK